MPHHIKDALCDALDPPNSRGNDWRMLAKRLGVDRSVSHPNARSKYTINVYSIAIRIFVFVSLKADRSVMSAIVYRISMF